LFEFIEVRNLLDVGLTRRNIAEIHPFISRAFHEFNWALRDIDETWLENFGIVQTKELKLVYFTDFMDIYVHAHKFIDPGYKPLTTKIEAIRQKLIAYISNGRWED